MKEEGYPKFQWSVFLNGKEEQVVIRGDDWEQFVLDVEAVKGEFLKKEKLPFPDDIDIPEDTSLDEAVEKNICPIHKIVMTERQGQYGTFYSHWDKEKGYCNGKGWKT